METRPPLTVGPALLEPMHPLGGYDTLIPLSAERFFENLLDWEHLPHLHPSAFGSVELVAEGRWWWTCRVGTKGEEAPTRLTSVVVDPDTLTYVVRNPTELVHVSLAVLGERELSARVRFYTDRAPRNEAVRRAMLALYERQFRGLATEDQDAMLWREAALERLAAKVSDVSAGQDLGAVAELRERAPLLLTWKGTRYWVVAWDDGFRVHAADCPHRLGPLPPADPSATSGACRGELRCPWHGYRFDPTLGRSTDGHGLALRPPFRVEVSGGRARVALPEAYST